MEVIVAGSLLGVGYLLNNNIPNKQFRQYDNKKPNPINPTILQQSDALTTNAYNTTHKIEAQKIEKNYNKAKDAVNTNIIPPYFNEAIFNQQTNNVQYLQRPIAERSTKIKNENNNDGLENFYQPLIAQPGYADGPEMFSALTGTNINSFSHNNQVPFFRGSNKQNVDPLANQAILESFGGINTFQIEKQPVEPMFKPQKNLSFINGTPNQSEMVLDRYVPSLYRTNEVPTDPIHVGPGLNKGYTANPTGGFQQFDTMEYALPKTTDEIRTLNNPKLTFEGRATGAPKSVVSNRGLQGTVKHRHPDKFYVQTPNMYLKTTGAYLKPELAGKFDAKATSRQDSISYDGVAGPASSHISSLRPAVRDSNNINFTTDGMRNANLQIYGEGDKNDYSKNSYFARPNERETTEDKSIITNLTSTVKAIIAPFLDIFRTTRKQNIIGNPNKVGFMGTQAPSKPIIWNPNNVARTTLKETNIHNNHNGNMASYARKPVVYDPNDVARTTLKETNIHNNHSGNMVSQARKPVVYDPNDVARTTIKETNIHNNHSGNMVPSSSRKPTVYDPNDVARTTIKETNIHNNHSGNMVSQARKPVVYDPNDVARTTIKETNIHNNHSGNMVPSSSRKPTVYDPNDVAKTTIKETNIHNNHSGNMVPSSSRKPIVYDPNDIARTTIKETNIHNNHSGNMVPSSYKKQTVYDPNDVTRTTIKETNIHNNRKGNLGSTTLQNGTGYETTEFNAPNTNRQFTSDYEYSGVADGQTGKGPGEGYLTAEYDAPNTNRQFTSDHEYSGVADGQTGKGPGEGYLTAEYDAPNTNRQFTSDFEYEGPAKDYLEKPMDETMWDNARLNETKTDVSNGRYPTLSNTKLAIGGNDINMEAKKLDQDRVNQYSPAVNRLYTQTPSLNKCTVTTDKDQLPNESLNNRIDPNMLTAFNDNPYTQPLNSYY
jgi:hypothetical protein